MGLELKPRRGRGLWDRIGPRFPRPEIESAGAPHTERRESARARHRECRETRSSAESGDRAPGARHRDSRGPTQRAPTQRATERRDPSQRARERRSLTQRVPGSDTKNAPGELKNLDRMSLDAGDSRCRGLLFRWKKERMTQKAFVNGSYNHRLAFASQSVCLSKHARTIEILLEKCW